MRAVIPAFLVSVMLGSCSGGGGSASPAPTPTTPTPVNSSPIVASANADQVATTNQPYSYDATKNGAVFSDADGDALSYTVSYSPAANGLTDSNGQIGGTPNVIGEIEVTITANDGNGGSVSDVFNVNVQAASASTKPNILLIISDDQGQDSSAQYSLSTDVPNTPILNALADDGIVFDNAWVYPVCTPTRASIITGKYGVQTNVLQVGDPLATSETILQELMSSDANTSEYNTAMIGKWHLGGGRTGPNDAGIDHFAGIIGGGVSDYYSWSLNVNGANSTSTNYVTTELADQAISWVGGQIEPWFLWMSFNAPHTPFHAPPASLHSQTLIGTTADINANPRPYYLAAIEAMDTEIGRFLDSLSFAERENTIIIYIGDNGTPSQVRDQAVFPQGAKGSLTQGGVNVPMFVSGAGVTRQGEREARLINGTDLYSTIAELAGSTVGNQNNSESFVDSLTQANIMGRDYIYSELGGSGWTIRNERYKLMVTDAGAETLFDLQLDPQENTDLLSGSTDVTAIRDALKLAGDVLRS